MFVKHQAVLLCALAATLSRSAFAQAADDKNAIGKAATNYTCQTVGATKFNETKYTALDAMERVLVDAQWQQCQLAKDKDTTQFVVAVVNPAPTSDNDRVFYGMVKTKDLAKAERTCASNSGTVGATLAVAGTAAGNPVATTAGSMIFEYGDVSCKSLSKAVGSGNLLAVLAPEVIVEHAVATKITGDVITAVPLLSSADKKNVIKALSNAVAPPSVSVSGPNVTVKAGGVSLSVKKPRVKIKW